MWSLKAVNVLSLESIVFEVLGVERLAVGSKVQEWRARLLILEDMDVTPYVVVDAALWLGGPGCRYYPCHWRRNSP